MSKHGDIIFKSPGDIIFKSPTKEFLRLKGDGAILVEGRRAGADPEVVSSLRRWLAHGTLTRTETPGSMKKDELRGGDLSFQASIKGGNATLTQGEGPPSPGLADKTTRPELDACDAEILWALVKKHGFLRVLRVLEGEAMKLGPESSVRLAEQISPSHFEGREPMDEMI